MSSQPVRAGVVGLGRSGWHLHVQVMQRMEGFEVTAVADPMEERREEAIQATGCTAYTDPEALIQDDRIELVVVATPSHTHADLACKALEAGKHVLVEKPMAMSVEEADRMIEAANKSNRLLTVYQLRRLDPDYVRLREILDSGVLGPLVLVRLARHSYRRRSDWQTLRKFGGGMLNNWGAHIVDQGLEILGGPVDRFFADMQQTVSAGDAEDHFKITMKGESDVVVDVEVSSCVAYPGPEYLVVGKYGSLQGSTRRFEYKYYDPKAVPELVADEGPAEGRSYGKPEELPWVEKSEEIQGSGDVKVTFYQNLYNAIRKGEPLLVTPESVRRQIAFFDDVRKQSGFEL